MRALLAGLLLVAGCPTAAPPDEAPEPTYFGGAHRALVGCATECHDSRQPTAKPPALVIFDLANPRWPDEFPVDHLDGIRRRLGVFGPSDRIALEYFIAVRAR